MSPLWLKLGVNKVKVKSILSILSTPACYWCDSISNQSPAIDTRLSAQVCFTVGVDEAVNCSTTQTLWCVPPAPIPVFTVTKISPTDPSFILRYVVCIFSFTCRESPLCSCVIPWFQMSGNHFLPRTVLSLSICQIERLVTLYAHSLLDSLVY